MWYCVLFRGEVCTLGLVVDASVREKFINSFHLVCVMQVYDFAIIVSRSAHCHLHIPFIRASCDVCCVAVQWFVTI